MLLAVGLGILAIAVVLYGLIYILEALVGPAHNEGAQSVPYAPAHLVMTIAVVVIALHWVL